MRSFCKLLFLLLGVPSLTFAITDVEDDCAHFLHYEKQTYRIWGVVTDRSSKEIKEALQDGNKREYLDGVNGPLPILNMFSILKGQKTLLSLGEGVSTFVSGILSYQSRNKIPLAAYAVDLAYKSTAMFDEKALLFVRDEAQKVFSRLKAFPGHYVGAYFQDFQVPNSEGTPIAFDEIISSHSLVYLLNRSWNLPPEQRLKTKQQDKDLLRSVVKNLKPGGVLRFWPYISAPAVLGPRQQYMKDLFEELRHEGVIRNHNLIWSAEDPDPTKSAREFLILQK